MQLELVKALGDVLRDARMDSGLSQEELAGSVGLHRNTVGLVERGEISISLETLDLVCLALGLLPWEVLLEAEFRRGGLEVHA